MSVNKYRTVYREIFFKKLIKTQVLPIELMVRTGFQSSLKKLNMADFKNCRLGASCGSGANPPPASYCTVQCWTLLIILKSLKFPFAHYKRATVSDTLRLLMTNEQQQWLALVHEQNTLLLTKNKQISQTNEWVSPNPGFCVISFVFCCMFKSIISHIWIFFQIILSW